MGLIRAAKNAAKGVLADQWKEYFYCEALPAEVLAVKGQKRVKGRSANKGSDNIISNGSVIAVAEGQCMMIVEQGKVVDVCAEPGEYTYDISSEPSLFLGDSLAANFVQVFENIGKRFTFGGEAPKDQRVYYFNTKEITGNKYGTPSPVPFRVLDMRAGIDMDISIRCFGEYSYRIVNPLLFYTNVCGNVTESYERNQLDGQLKTELLTALQPAFARISEMGIRYSALPGHTTEIAGALNEELSAKWRDVRGLEIVAFGVSSVKANEEDEQIIKEMQREVAYTDPARAAGVLARAQAEAMKAAASNTSAGPAMAFMGMGMAGQAGGMNAQALYQMAQENQNRQAQMAGGQFANAGQPGFGAGAGQMPTGGNGAATGGNAGIQGNGSGSGASDTWNCTCGQTGNTGKFCPSCGQPRPVPVDAGWVCSCGAVNKGKFCSECGKPKPTGVPQYRCDKCGWEPEDPAHPPKFCPECGDPFDDGDIQR